MLCANSLRRAGLGQKTRQFNPGTQTQSAKTLGQWLTAVQSMKGLSDAMTVGAAVAMIHGTPAEVRSGFAREIWRLRRRHGTDGRKVEVPF